MRRYPDAYIQLSDNVLSRNMIRSLLPKMAEDDVPYRILGEVRTNLSSEEMRMLAKAGFYCVQPGIESLNDHLLELMGKGSSAILHHLPAGYCSPVFPDTELHRRNSGLS